MHVVQGISNCGSNDEIQILLYNGDLEVDWGMRSQEPFSGDLSNAIIFREPGMYYQLRPLVPGRNVPSFRYNE